MRRQDGWVHRNQNILFRLRNVIYLKHPSRSHHLYWTLNGISNPKLATYKFERRCMRQKRTTSSVSCSRWTHCEKSESKCANGGNQVPPEDTLNTWNPRQFWIARWTLYYLVSRNKDRIPSYSLKNRHRTLHIDSRVNGKFPAARTYTCPFGSVYKLPGTIQITGK